MGKRSHQLTSARQSANHGQIGQLVTPVSYVGGFSFLVSELLGINIEGLNSLLLWIELFI